MEQLELDLDAYYDTAIELSEINYAEDPLRDFPTSELDSIILSYQSPMGNGFSVLNAEDAVTWPTLLVEFAKVLNKAGFVINIDQLEEKLYE